MGLFSRPALEQWVFTFLRAQSCQMYGGFIKSQPQKAVRCPHPSKSPLGGFSERNSYHKIHDSFVSAPARNGKSPLVNRGTWM